MEIKDTFSRSLSSALHKNNNPREPTPVPVRSQPEDRFPIRWNAKLEAEAKNIGESAQGYKLMHIIQAQYSNKIYKSLMMVGIISGPTVGFIIGINTVIGESLILSLIAMIISFLSGIVIAIVKFGKYNEVSSANKKAAARYTSIESNVRRQLNLYRVDRKPSTVYLDWLETKYEEIFTSAPLLPAKTYDEYSPIAKEAGLNVPTRYAKKIDVNTTYEEEKIKEIIGNSDIYVTKDSDITQLSPKDVAIDMTPEKMMRTNSMSQFADFNYGSNKMLEYEMARMTGFRE